LRAEYRHGARGRLPARHPALPGAVRAAVLRLRRLALTTRTRIREEHWNPAPGGYRAWRRQTYLGSGDAFWEQSAAALLRWEVKTRCGFRISPQDKVRSGARTQIIVPVGPVSIHEPVEVVDVVEADDVVGFAYRTLPGHPVSG